MIDLLIHRACYENPGSDQVEIHGVLVISVPDFWTPQMGFMMEGDADPWMPEEFDCFVNSLGHPVVVFNEWHKTSCEETLKELAELWFFIGDWRLLKSYFHVQCLSPELISQLPRIMEAFD